jgi:hypothetical protein
MYRMQIASKQMAEDLSRLSVVPGKTTRLSLPPVPNRLFGDFLRGYFDGDGNIWVGTTHTNRENSDTGILVSFTSGCESFLSDLAIELRDRGITGSFFKIKNRAAWRLQFSTNSSILLHRLMYDDLSGKLFLPGQRSRFTEYIKQKS